MVPEVPVQSAPILGASIFESRSAEAKPFEGQPFSICFEEALDAKDDSNQASSPNILSASAHVPVMTAMAFGTVVHTVEHVCTPQTVVESPAISVGSGSCVATEMAVASCQGEIVNHDVVAEEDLPHPHVSVPSMSASSNSQESNVSGVQTQVVFSRASENIAQNQNILAGRQEVAQLPGDTSLIRPSFDSGEDALSRDIGSSAASREQSVVGNRSTVSSNTVPLLTDSQVLEGVESGGSKVGEQVSDGVRVVTRKPVGKDGCMVGHQSDLSWQQQPVFGETEHVTDLVGYNCSVQGVSHIESFTLHNLETSAVAADRGDLVSESDRGKESADGKLASRDVLNDHNIRCAFNALGADRSELLNHRLSETSALVSTPAGVDFPVRLINQIVRAISLRRSDDRTEILIRLHPPELGSVAVRVVQDTQGLSSHINTSTEEVRNLLQSHLPLLKNALLEAGVNLSSVTVSHDSSLNNTLGSPTHQGWNQQDGNLYQNRRAFYTNRGGSEGMIEGRDWMVVSIPASSPVDSARYTWLA